MDWQPIESAPRDGTEIDVWCFCHDPEWRREHGIQSGTRVPFSFWCDGEWMIFDARDGESVPVGSSHYTVSHWMPVPSPPIME